ASRQPWHKRVISCCSRLTVGRVVVCYADSELGPPQRPFVANHRRCRRHPIPDAPPPRQPCQPERERLTWTTRDPSVPSPKLPRCSVSRERSRTSSSHAETSPRSVSEGDWSYPARRSMSCSTNRPTMAGPRRYVPTAP